MRSHAERGSDQGTVSNLMIVTTLRVGMQLLTLRVRFFIANEKGHHRW